MSKRVCQESDYIEFLLAAQRVFSCVEASASAPESLSGVAHDAYTRLLTRRPLETGALWDEAQRVVGSALFEGGLLVLDDTTLDKPYARHMDLVTRHWSGKHGRVVSGINLLSLVWTPGYTAEEYQQKLALKQLALKKKRKPTLESNLESEIEVEIEVEIEEASWEENLEAVAMPAVIPLDFAVYDVNALLNNKRMTKNDHLRALLQRAKERGLAPRYVTFDAWYSGLPHLKAVRDLEWYFLTRLEPNRSVNPEQSGLVQVHTLEVPTQGQEVWLKGFGLVRLFQRTRSDGKGGETVEHWVTNDLDMKPEQWQRLALSCWVIETYHRGIKSCCGIEKAQVRSATGQKNHLLLALRAFLRLEHNRLQTGISWYQAKIQPIRNAIKFARHIAAYRIPLTA